MRAFLLFIILLPVLDLALMGHLIGFWPTVLLVLGTGCLGLMLIRRQGSSALMQGRNKIAAGRFPLKEMTTGVFLALAGILLIHPGVITDVLALLCLIPNVRVLLAGILSSRIPSGLDGAHRTAGYRARSEAGSGDIIEGEYDEVSAAEGVKPPTRIDKK